MMHKIAMCISFLAIYWRWHTEFENLQKYVTTGPTYAVTCYFLLVMQHNENSRLRHEPLCPI